MPDMPGQEPLDGMPHMPEDSRARTEDEKSLHAELIATQAEAHPAAPEDEDRGADAEQRGGSTNLSAAERNARAATRAARIAEAQAVLAAGSAELKRREAEMAAAKLTDPPSKPSLQTEQPKPTSTPPDDGKGAQRLAELLRHERLKGVPAENILDTEAATQAWIDRRAEKPEID